MNAFAKIWACALFAVVAGAGFAQPAPQGFGSHRTEWLKQAGLTDDQIKQVSDVWSQQLTEAAPLRAQLKVLNAQIEQAMTGPAPDLKAASALVDKKAQVKADLEKRRLAAQAKLQQIVGNDKYLQLKRMLFGKQPRMGRMRS